LCLIVYFTCFANLSKKIDPTGQITVANNKATVKDGDTNYVVDLSNHSNT
jgi:hypothetical protein